VHDPTTPLDLFDDNIWDPINTACHYARHGLLVISCIRKAPWRVGWYDLGSTRVSDVVQDFEDAIHRAGTTELVWVGWTLGVQGYMALDIDRPDLVDPELQAVLDAGGYAVNPTSRPGRYHAIYRMPDGMTVGNSTSRFPTRDWGELRGYHGQIVIAGPDRPGFDITQLGPLP
jgi:hypothetical protein